VSVRAPRPSTLHAKRVLSILARPWGCQEYIVGPGTRVREGKRKHDLRFDSGPGVSVVSAPARCGRVWLWAVSKANRASVGMRLSQDSYAIVCLSWSFTFRTNLMVNRKSDFPPRPV
jgi:hypothetical protein